MAPPDPILGTTLAWKADKDPKKINLGVGAYRDDNELPQVFQAVRRVEQEIVFDLKNDHEYLPIDGHAGFVKYSRELLFGKESAAVKGNRVASAQAISGTGALRVAFEFINTHASSVILVPNPTWITHHAIIKNAGLKFQEYPYYDEKTRGLNFEGFIGALKQAKPGTWVLLHACAHNPTGVDPTFEQWKQVAAVMKEGGLLPLFDSAYQGFATGDLVQDAAAIRFFVEQGFQTIVTQSFAKNMGLYGERVGAIHIVCTDDKTAEIVLSQLKLVIRPMYSNPPAHGAKVAAAILGDPKNFKEWQDELTKVSHRIIHMRKILRQKLEDLKVPGSWTHITSQIGMFSYTGLTPEQCDIVINKHHVYLLRNGRISMCGVTTKNVEHLAKAIADAIASTAAKKQ
jgi:aspartate/tyrosine/aromatic aminotransferase